MFIAALSLKGQKWNQPKFSGLIGKQITFIQWTTYNSAMKRNKLLINTITLDGFQMYYGK